MRWTLILGVAVTAGLLTMVAGVVGAVVAVSQASVTPGVATRSVLVAVVLVATCLFWWPRMRSDDRPATLVAGLMGGWLLNVNSWNGRSFAGQLVTDGPVVAALLDLVLWGVVACALVLALSRNSRIEG